MDGQKARRTRATMLAGPTLPHIVRARVRAACRASWQKEARPDASELARSLADDSRLLVREDAHADHNAVKHQFLPNIPLLAIRVCNSRKIVEEKSRV